MTSSSLVYNVEILALKRLSIGLTRIIREVNDKLKEKFSQVTVAYYAMIMCHKIIYGKMVLISKIKVQIFQQLIL